MAALPGARHRVGRRQSRALLRSIDRDKQRAKAGAPRREPRAPVIELGRCPLPSAVARSPKRSPRSGKTGCGRSTRCWPMSGWSRPSTRRWRGAGRTADARAPRHACRRGAAAAAAQAHAQLELRRGRARGARQPGLPSVYAGGRRQGARCEDAGQARPGPGARGGRAAAPAGGGDRREAGRGGRRMRVDTTVVETNIHYPTDSVLLGDGVRVLTRTMKQITELAGARGRQTARPHAEHPAMPDPDRARRAQPQRARQGAYAAVLPEAARDHRTGGRQAKRFAGEMAAG